VPAGPEQCDGLDNDCNGSIDEGLANCTCQTDADCGDPTSGKVCDDSLKFCADGCRGMGGNGCPDPLVCTSTDASIGMCIDASSGSATGTGGAGGQGGSGGVPAGVYVQGGCTCSAQPEKDSSKPAWFFVFAAGAALCRRRRR
jgi:MYXO-CTERM domain-containing protein